MLATSAPVLSLQCRQCSMLVIYHQDSLTYSEYCNLISGYSYLSKQTTGPRCALVDISQGKARQCDDNPEEIWPVSECKGLNRWAWRSRVSYRFLLKLPEHYHSGIRNIIRMIINGFISPAKDTKQHTGILYRFPFPPSFASIVIFFLHNRILNISNLVSYKYYILTNQRSLFLLTLFRPAGWDSAHDDLGR